MSSSGANASASIVGQRATNRSNRGMTVATVVCDDVEADDLLEQIFDVHVHRRVLAVLTMLRAMP